MNTPVLTQKQLRKSLSAKKGPLKGLKNVLAQPFESFWPIINNDESAVLETLLKRLLSASKKSKPKKISWSELRKISKEERQIIKKEAQNEVNLDTNINEAESIVFGINSATRLLEKSNACSILLDSTTDPSLLIKHIIVMAQNKNVPVLLVPFLKKVTLESIGFSSASIGLKKIVENSEENHFFPLHKKISSLASDITKSKASVSLFKDICVMDHKSNLYNSSFKNIEKDILLKSVKLDYGFCDLCINLGENKSELRTLLSKLYSVGYKTVALNQSISETIFSNQDGNKKKRKKKDSDNDADSPIIPEPIEIEDLVEEFKGKLKILNRITFSFSNQDKTKFLKESQTVKKYHIYAVIPENQSALQYACGYLNVDMILINSSCHKLKLNRKLYMQAVDRGIRFEIQYCDIINQSSRVMAIHQAHSFFTFGKSKNIVITSGASNSSCIRNPYDVINLARLLGLSEEQAQFAIFQQAQHLLSKADGRRCGSALFKIYCKKLDNHQSSPDKVEENEDETKKSMLFSDIYSYRRSKLERAHTFHNESKEERLTETADFIPISDYNIDVINEVTPMMLCDRGNLKLYKTGNSPKKTIIEKNKSPKNSNEIDIESKMNQVKYIPLKVKRLQGDIHRSKRTKLKGKS